VNGEFGIDVLAAIPVNALPRGFVEKQWPHLVSRARKAKPYAKLSRPPR
jgi:hypothetical protein